MCVWIEVDLEHWLAKVRILKIIAEGGEKIRRHRDRVGRGGGMSKILGIQNDRVGSVICFMNNYYLT